MSEFPKKLLRITDLTFILPDDFEGDLLDAMKVLTDYLAPRKSVTEIERQNSSTIASLLEKGDDKSKICMNYGIFEADKSGNYTLK